LVLGQQTSFNIHLGLASGLDVTNWKLRPERGSGPPCVNLQKREGGRALFPPGASWSDALSLLLYALVYCRKEKET